MLERSHKQTGRRRIRLGSWLLIFWLPIVLLWAFSGWWQLGLRLGPVGTVALDGHVTFYWTDSSNTQVWFADRAYTINPKWDAYLHKSDFPPGSSSINLLLVDLYSIDGKTEAYRGIRAVLWFPMVALAVAGAAFIVSARRARRRQMTHICAGCGYDLTGLTSKAICPECGRVSAKA